MPESLHAELARMQIILADLESRLEAGEVDREALPGFKSAVDDVRMRVWGLLTAAGSSDVRESSERFRLRRGAELCRTLAQELASGRLQAGHVEWQEIQTAASHLLAVIAERTGQAA